MRYFAKIAFDGFVLWLGQKKRISTRRAAGMAMKSVVSSVLCIGKVRWIDDRLMS